ncbi:MAG: hypothetical protein EOP51_05195 [Sphingobacteriales bacterium]|nr:MAG: hypothetical protein EOP51_05195 [Sphingobacteriales bacterium]
MKNIVSLLLMLIVYTSYGQTGILTNKYYISGSLSVGSGDRKFADTNAYLQIGTDSSTKGLLMPRGNVNNINAGSKQGLYFHNSADSSLYSVNGNEKLKQLNENDASRFSPFINKEGGYQLVGLKLQQHNGFSNALQILFWNNGVISGIHKIDSANSHVSSNSSLAFEQSFDVGKTWTQYKTFISANEINKEYRAWGGFQKSNGNIELVLGKYIISPAIVMDSIFRMTLDSVGNVIALPIPIGIQPTSGAPLAPGGPFGNSVIQNNHIFQMYYKLDSIFVYEYLGNDWVVKQKWYWPFASEPALVGLGGDEWVVYVRRELSNASDTAKPGRFYTNNSFSSVPQWKGYADVKAGASRVAGGAIYDSARKNIIIIWPERIGYSKGIAYGIEDSLDFLVISKQDLIAGLPERHWNRLARPTYSTQTDYGYPFLVQISRDQFFWSETSRYGSGSSSIFPREVSDIYQGYINFVPPHSHGGLNSKYTDGLTICKAPYYDDIIDFKSYNTGMPKPVGPITANMVPLLSNTNNGAVWTDVANLPAPLFDSVLSRNNIISKPIFVKTNPNIILGDINQSVYFSAPDTGSVIFKHVRVSSGINHKWVISGSSVGASSLKSSFSAEIDWQVVSSAGISATINSKVLVTALDGALPFDTVYVTQGTGDSTTLIIGSLNNQWPAGYNITLKKVEIKGAAFTNNAWWNGYNTNFVKDWSLLPNAKVKPPIVKPITTANLISASATLDFPSTVAGTSSELSISLSGAVLGDVVSVGLPATLPATGTFSAYVSAANIVKVRFANNSTSTAYDPASGLFKITIIR